MGLSGALVRAEELPGEWVYVEPSSAEGPDTDPCGSPRERPRPTGSASVGWAIDPVDGPVFGERIERFATGDAVAALVDGQSGFPCTFVVDGVRWRTEELDPGALGDLGASTRVWLVTNLDRDDSFNYGSRSDPVVSHCSPC